MGRSKNIKPPKTRKRQRAAPSPYAFAYTVADAQSMGGPAKTLLYQMLKDGRLQRAPDPTRTMITGKSLRALLGINEEVSA
jgi:hypothetical protein